MSSSTLVSTPDMIFSLSEKLFLRSLEEPWLIPLCEYYIAKANKLEHSGWKVRTGMTQVDKIIKHLHVAGSITQREAYIDYGIQSFHRHLTDLQYMGYEIKGERKYHPTTGQEYTRYYLVRDPYVTLKVA